MRRALIGFGTPLGSYLAQTRSFSDCYTYKQALNGIAACDEAVLVAPGDKRLGGHSLSPQAHALVAALELAAGQIVLLSSIDVYPCKGVPFDEAARPGEWAGKAWLAYFETELHACGARALILRLPDVFGLGSSRANACCVPGGDPSKINRVAIHQWYPARRLLSDIRKAHELEMSVVNLVPEPLAMHAVLKQYFPRQVGQVRTPAPYSRIQTRHAEKFGGSGAYILSAKEVLEEIGRDLRAIGVLPGAPKQSPAVEAGAAAYG